eukprot:Polyplicarium_translucidae@DN3356_c0_g1_i6.p1
MEQRMSTPEEVEDTEAKGESVTEDLAEELGIDKLRPGCCGSVALQAAGAALCGSFLFGYCLAVLNTSFLTINAEYGWCDVPAQSDCDNSVTLGSLINTAVFIGATFGAIITQWFIYLGCRTNMLMSFGVIAVGTICCLVSNSFAALFWGRLFVGYGVGITSLVTPMYIAEISPAHVRGSYGTLHQLTICVGIFLSILIGLPFSSVPQSDDDGWADWTPPSFDKAWWRVMLGLTILPCLIGGFLLGKKFKFETPHYYVEKGDMRTAEILLRVLHAKEDISEELGDIQRGALEGKMARENGMTLWKALANSEYRFAIAVGVLLCSFFQLSGLNVFTTQSNALFATAGLEGTLVTVMSTLLTFANVVMVLPAVWLIEKLGRRSLMLAGTIGQTLAILPSAILLWIDEDSSVTGWMSVASATLFACVFSCTYGPVFWVFLFEI